MEKKNFFDNPLFRTKITSANVKPKEMLLGYFIAPFCALISNAIFGSYLNRYYSDVLGWTDTTKFGIFSAILPMISVIFVIIGNLVVGHLMDNTRTSQGKARPFMLLSAPLVTAAIALLFLTPESASPAVQRAWIAISYNLYYAVAYPFYYTAHSSLVSLSTRNSNHRGMLATFSNASGVAAVGVGASILVPILLQSFLFVDHDGVIDTTASYNNWRIVMIVLCVVTFFAILLEYFFTRERITEENMKLNIKEEKLPMNRQVKACVSNAYWWIIILYFLLFQFGGLVKNGSMSYYARWMFDGISTEAAAGTAMGTLGLIGGLPTAIGMVIAWPIADKLGKQRAVTIGLGISVVGGLVSFLNVHSFGMVATSMVLKGIGSIPAVYVTMALLSDVLDHLEAKNGFRSDGFTMSVYSSIMVGLSGLCIGVLNSLLTFAGYSNTGIACNPQTLEIIENVANYTGQVVYRQMGGVEQVLAFAFLAADVITYAVVIILMSRLDVEKHIEEDQKTIKENQKKAALKK